MKGLKQKNATRLYFLKEGGRRRAPGVTRRIWKKEEQRLEGRGRERGSEKKVRLLAGEEKKKSWGPLGLLVDSRKKENSWGRRQGKRERRRGAPCHVNLWADSRRNGGKSGDLAFQATRWRKKKRASIKTRKMQRGERRQHLDTFVDLGGGEV